MPFPKEVQETLTLKFFERRELLLVTDVNAGVQSTLTQGILALNRLSKEPVTLIIDSAGGDLKPGTWIADAIRHSEAPVTGLVVGAAYSMAFLILQHCHRRLAWPNARLLTHGITTNGLRIDDPEFPRRIRELRAQTAAQLAFFAERSGQPLAHWRRWSRHERNFPASEALTLGMLDGIVPANPIPGME